MHGNTTGLKTATPISGSTPPPPPRAWAIANARFVPYDSSLFDHTSAVLSCLNLGRREKWGKGGRGLGWREATMDKREGVDEH